MEFKGGKFVHGCRVLVGRRFYHQGLFLANKVMLEGAPTPPISYGNSLRSILRQMAGGSSSHTAYSLCGIKFIEISAIKRRVFQTWFHSLSTFGKVAQEACLSLRAAEHSTSSLRVKISAHGQRAQVRMYGQYMWQRLCMQYGCHRPVLLPFNVIVRAASLGFTRSQIPLGLFAVALGSFNQCFVEAESSHGNAPLHRAYKVSSSVLSSGVRSIFEFIVLVSRAFYLLLLFSPAILTAPLADSFGMKFRQAWLKLLRRTLELAGAAFIKWGQWAATRPDLFPKDLCLELSKLQTKAPAHKYSYTLHAVEKAFGQKLHDIFEEFDEEPIASGSIAQVHKATLRYGYPGKKSKPLLVAVKVRHPGVSEVIRQDFMIIKRIAGLSTLVPGLRWLRLDESVQQFAVFMLTQVDLAREAAHLSRFLYNFRQWNDVSFPRPLYPLVHPAVLVETYEQGESVSRFVELPEKTRINSTLAHIGTHTLLKMLLVDNFIHADMHPGNILVRVKKKKLGSAKGLFPNKPQVVFLDVGMTAELSSHDRINLLDFFKAVALRDGRMAAECALRFSRDQSCPDPAAFIREVESSFRLWGSKEGEDIHPGDCMQDLLEQVQRHRVNVDGDVCTVMVTTMVLESWQRQLDPNYNIMKTLQTLLFKVDWAKSLAYTINGVMAP